MSATLDVTEFLAGFLAEAEEHIASATAHLLAIESLVARRQGTPRQVRELFRSLHTIKGLSAMVGVEPIVDISHAMEAVLRLADRAGGSLSPESHEALVKGIKAIDQRVRAVAKQRPVPPAPAALIETLSRLQSVDADAGAETRAELMLDAAVADKLNAGERQQLAQGVAGGRLALQAEFVPSASRSAAGTTITTVRERLARVSELVKIVPLSVPVAEGAPSGLKFILFVLTDAAHAAEVAAAVETPVDRLLPILMRTPTPLPAGDGQQELEGDEVEGTRDAAPTIRVEVRRLDDGLEKLAALVVTQFRLVSAVAKLAAAGSDVRELRQTVSDNGRHLRELRGAIVRARMVRASDLLERIPLLVRGLARTTGKQVLLDMKGATVELDKAVADRIFPAIVHLVRNAVDHALESPEERQRLGKPADGMVRIDCQQRSDSLLELTVSDDGRGVDREAVARRAGTAVPETEQALLALLARPGLSTRQEVTTTSGRGVGMDIVKRIVVDELGGALRLHTTVGAGSSFILQIPLSITIIDAFAFFCAGQTFVVPAAMVEEIQEMDLSRVVRGPDRRRAVRGPDRRAPDQEAGMRGAGMIERRGEAIPVMALDEVLGFAGGDDHPPVDSPSLSAGVRQKLIIVRRNGQPFGFVVDRMLGRQQIVVRPLQDPLVKVNGVPGSTDLGDGRPTLVLDLAALGGMRASATSGAPS